MSTLDLYKIRYKHFSDYIDGWFEIYDQKQREKIIYNDDTFEFEFKKPYCHMQNYINKQDYETQKKKWDELVNKNSDKYTQILQQIINFFNKFPQSFKEIYPPPAEFAAYRSRLRVNLPLNKRWKNYKQNMEKILSFKLLKRNSKQMKQIKQSLFSKGEIKHISIKQANALKTGELIDYRSKNGKFHIVKVIKKNDNNSRIKIKYYKQNPSIEQWCDCNIDFYNMYVARSVSERPIFKYKQLNIGSEIYINLNTETQFEWKIAIIKQFDILSGQVEVSFDNGKRLYWLHPDNINEFSIHDNNDNNNKKRKRVSDSDDEPIIKKRKLNNKFDNVNGMNRNIKRCINDKGLVKIETFNGENNLEQIVTVHNHFINGIANIPALESEECIVMNNGLNNGNGSGNIFEGINENFYNDNNLKNEMEFYRKECEGLKEKIKLFNGMSDEINKMNWKELNELELKLKNGIKSVENAKERLWNNNYESVYCIVCRDNKRNVCFMDGCNHFVLCIQCERKVLVKKCPICKVSYAKIKRIDI